MLKDKRIGLIIIGVILIGVCGVVAYHLLNPAKQYTIIQQDRSIELNNTDLTQRDFVMSPAKILIPKMKKGQSITIPVKIINGTGETVYNVKFGDPAIFDSGYLNADGNNDYSYTWDKNSLDIQGNTTEVVNIKVTQLVNNAEINIEKGIAITQQVGSGINIARSYIFEILIK